MISDSGEDVCEPCLRVGAVHFCRRDQAVHHRGALTAAVGAGEQPIAAPRARLRIALSAALFDRQTRPSLRKREKEGQRVSV